MTLDLAPHSPMRETGRSWLAWLPVSVCVGVNLSILWAVARDNGQYLTDYKLNKKWDANHYVLLGRNFLLDGHYSRMSKPPYVPDILRTPVYPLLAGGLDILGGAGAIYVAQACLHALACWLLFHLVRPYFGKGAAFLAATFLATDLMLAVQNFEAMSEPVFLFLTLASAYFLFPAILGEASVSPVRIGLGGLSLALATLTRPAGLYVPLVLALLLLGHGIHQRRLWVSLRQAILLLLVALAPVAGWIGRNTYVFSLPRLTNNDAIMKVYFAGGGAYVMERGLTLDEAHDAIAREFNLTHPHITNNHWNTDKPVAEIDAELRAAAWPVLLKYPRSLFISSVLGIVKSSFAHNVGALGDILDETWVRPDGSALMRGESSAFQRLAQNSPFLIGVCLWQMGHAVVAAGLALVGLAIALRRATARPFAVLLIVVLAYFFLTVALVGCEAFARSRVPHLPFLYAFTGLGASIFLSRRFLEEQQP